MKALFVLPVIALFLLFTPSCKQSMSPNRSALPANPDITSFATQDFPNLSLADYLRRIPGVQVQGNSSNAQVFVRGLSSFESTNTPLFVIDGVQVGNDFQQAAANIDPNDILSVTVLKDAASTLEYGIRGGSGVILIKTKRTEVPNSRKRSS